MPGGRYADGEQIQFLRAGGGQGVDRSVKEKSAIIIESQDLHETFSAVFEGLYTVSQPINTQK